MPVAAVRCSRRGAERMRARRSPSTSRSRHYCAPDQWQFIVVPTSDLKRVPREVGALFFVRETVRSRLRDESGRIPGDGEVFDAMLDCALLAWTLRDPRACRPDPVVERPTAWPSSSGFARALRRWCATAPVTSKFRGPMSALFSATFPERAVALTMYGSYARWMRAPDYPWAPTRSGGERNHCKRLISQHFQESCAPGCARGRALGAVAGGGISRRSLSP